MNKVYISVVIPLLNEVENIEPLNKRIIEVLSSLNKPFEIIYVDDYSTDGSREVLDKIYRKYSCVKVVKFRRNFGQTAAMAAGFDYASGEIIVTMDGDMQNDPADIPKMIDKLNEGFDIVSGWRKDRKDSLIRTFPSKIANAMIRKLTGVYVNDYGCSLKVYTSRIAKEIDLYGEMHRFIPAIAAINGAEITEMPVKHYPRTKGISKYSIRRTFKVFLDLLTVVFFKKFLTRPLHAFGRAALLILFLVGLFSLVFLTDNVFHYIKLNILSFYDCVIIAFMMIFFALQLICTGIMAEIQVRTYFESQNKKIYSVKEFLSRETECLAKA